MWPNPCKVPEREFNEEERVVFFGLFFYFFGFSDMAAHCRQTAVFATSSDRKVIIMLSTMYGLE